MTQKASNRYQKIMFGSVTHEFRTPLNSSINALDFLEGKVAPEAVPHLRTAKSSNRILLSLIEDILDLTRLDANEFQLNKKRFRVREIAKFVDSLFRFQVRLRRTYLAGRGQGASVYR